MDRIWRRQRSDDLTDIDKSVARNSARESILTAAADLFHERGYSATSMQDIAQSVGFSRPALYYHFRDKHDILAALVEQITVRTEREAARIAGATSTRGAAAILRDMVRAHALLILERPAQFAVLLREERHLPEPARETQRRGKRDLLERYASVIAEGIGAAECRVVDPHLTALSIFGMCNWTVEWFRPAGRLRDVDVAGSIADFALTIVSRPAAEDDPASLRGWLNILRDDISQVERLIGSAKS